MADSTGHGELPKLSPMSGPSRAREGKAAWQ